MNKILVIITGHYGSGKTEFAVNYSVECAKNHKKVNIADLDVVNPYFRSREKAEELAKKGIRVIGSMIENSTLEFPSIPPEVRGMIEDKNTKTILDVGGDPEGARILAGYSSYIKEQDYEMLLIVNANRPQTQTLEDVLGYIESIEASSKLKITGLVNNTHLLKSTTKEDVIRGHKLVEEVSEATGLPVVYETAIKSVADEVKKDYKDLGVFPLDLYMRETWMS
jgi:hypothetical protein